MVRGYHKVKSEGENALLGCKGSQWSGLIDCESQSRAVRKDCFAENKRRDSYLLRILTTPPRCKASHKGQMENFSPLEFVVGQYVFLGCTPYLLVQLLGYGFDYWVAIRYFRRSPLLRLFIEVVCPQP